MSSALPQLIVSTVILGGIYALVSVGLTLVFGVMRIINFAHGEFLMLAMYLAFGMHLQFGVDPYLGILVAVPVSLLAAAGLFRYVIAPIIGQPHVVQIFTTLGLSIVLQNLALFLWSGNFRQLSLPYSDRIIELSGAAITVPQAIAFCVAAAATAVLFGWLRFSYTGKAMRATAQDRHAAILMGIDTRRIFMSAFLVGTVCVAIAGMLMAPLYPIYPTAGLHFVLIAFVVVVLGGLGSTVGALLGGLIVAFLETAGGFLIGSAWKDVLVFGVFIAVLLARPAGLFGQRGAEAL